MLNYLLMVTLLVITPITQAIDQINPYQLMNNIANKIFINLQSEQVQISQNPNYLRNIVRKELLPYVQVKYTGALVLGRFYRDATPAQRDAYFKIFQSYLEQAYSQVLALYTNQTYQIEIEKPLENTTVISTRITIFDKGIHRPIHLDFQWRKNSISSNWQIYDIITEGVSMITTKQNEWAYTLRTKGIDNLIQQLQIAASQPIILDKQNNG